MRKLALVLLFVASCAAQQIDPRQIRSGTFTQSQTFTQINNVVYADPQTGADACAKIAAAIALLPAGGGTVDARGLSGAQTCAANPMASAGTKRVEIILGNNITISSAVAWTTPSGFSLKCPGTASDQTGSCVFKPTGATWMFQSPDNSVAVRSPIFDNVTVDLRSNASALGAWNLDGIGASRLTSPRVFFGAGAGQIGIKFANLNVSNGYVYAYSNDVFNPWFFDSVTPANAHIGFYFTGNGNDNNVFGGAVENIGRPVVMDNLGITGSGDNNKFFGTDFEGFQAHAIELQNGAKGNGFYNTRAENGIVANTVAAPAAITLSRSGTTVTAVVSGGHSLYADPTFWSTYGGVINISGSTAGAFDGTFRPLTFDVTFPTTKFTWTQGSGTASDSTLGLTLKRGDIFFTSSTASLNAIVNPRPVTMARPYLNSSTTTYFNFQDDQGNTAANFPGTLSVIGTSAFTGAITATGGIKAGASGSTITDTRAIPQYVQACGTTTTCANTANGSTHIIYGSVALASASPSAATVASISPAFTSSSSYTCTATPTGATAAIAAGGIAISYVSGSSFTLTGPNTVTTVINYVCIGN